MTHEPSNVELYERVARIEQQVLHIDSTSTERRDQLNRIESRINAMENDLQRYRGSVGAVLLVATAVTTFFKLFWHDLVKFFK